MSRNARAAVIAVTGAALFMVVLDNLIVAATLPTLQRSLHTSLDSIEWVIDAYILTFGVALLTGAALGDRFGRRRMFVAGLALFTASSAAAGLASSVDALVLARVFQGLGGATLLPLTLTLVSTAFPPERRGFALGLWSAIAGIGIALGPIAGGLLVSAGSWHLIFWVNVPIGILAALGALRALPADRGAHEPLDPAGMALAAAGLFAIVEATVRAPRIGWGSPQTLVAYALGAVLIAAFVSHERHSDHAMIPGRLFADPRSAAINVSGFLLNFAMFDTFVLLIQYLVHDQGQSAIAAGVETLPWTIMPLLVSPFSGRLGRRIAPATLTAVGLTTLGLGLAGVALAIGSGAAPAALIPGLIVTGAGIGIALPNLASVAVGSVLPADIGKASGMINTSRQVGAVAGVAVGVAVAQATGSTAASVVVAAGAAAIGAFAAVGDRVRQGLVSIETARSAV
jgi:EmrB/QacA subfamily drug resistance transporter